MKLEDTIDEIENRKINISRVKKILIYVFYPLRHLINP